MAACEAVPTIKKKGATMMAMIEINMEGEAFKDDAREQLAWMLNCLAYDIGYDVTKGTETGCQKIRDSEGEIVGRFRIVEGGDQ